jgi:hypothetical protein
MSDEVDERITISLHPSALTTVDGYCEETLPALAIVESTFRSCYTALKAVHNFRELAARNAAWTEAAQIIQTDDLANKHRAKIAGAFDVTRQRLLDNIAMIERELSAPVTSRASLGIAAEVRAHAKGLTTENRVALVRHAINSGDEVTITAVLGGPSYLSGLSDELQAAFTRQYHERSSPAAVLRLRAMKGAVDLIERNAPLMHKAFEDAVGCPPNKARALREANTAAEKAAVFRDVA